MQSFSPLKCISSPKTLILCFMDEVLQNLVQMMTVNDSCKVIQRKGIQICIYSLGHNKIKSTF